jgi:hypothetical protein
MKGQVGGLREADALLHGGNNIEVECGGLYAYGDLKEGCCSSSCSISKTFISIAHPHWQYERLHRRTHLAGCLMAPPQCTTDAADRPRDSFSTRFKSPAACLTSSRTFAASASMVISRDALTEYATHWASRTGSIERFSSS